MLLTNKVAGRQLPAPSRRVSRRMCVQAQAAPGSKIEQWLKTPFDIAAFGPRATFGALVSMPERLQTLQSDIEKVTELLQDPRPLDEKRDVLLQEVEDTVVEFLERGTTIETDVLANVKAVLPPEVAQTIDSIVPPPPTNTVVTTATTTSTSVVQAEPIEPEVYYTSASVSVNQPAAEMSEIRDSVTSLKAALEAIKANTDPSQGSILKLNLKESRDRLSRRIQEVSPATASSQDPSLAAATREARVLLSEVDAEFF